MLGLQIPSHQNIANSEGAASAAFCLGLGQRVAEATNPGPCEESDVLWPGTSNPTGLHNKEEHAIGLGPGIWSYSETQLSAAGLPKCCRTLRFHARNNERDVRIHAGSPVALRPNSLWAGSWSGVLQTGDCPGKPLNLGWPPGLFATGRIRVAEHFIAGLRFVVASVYGYPSGPTWPNARQQTDDILACLSTEVVYCMKGPNHTWRSEP